MEHADHVAIVELIHRYARLIDEGRLDEQAALFEKGTLRSSRGIVSTGTDAVRKFIDMVVLYDGVPRSKHLITNVDVHVDPDGRAATASCYFTVLQATDGFPLQAIMCGTYDDTFAKDDGEWHFTERVISIQLRGDTSHHNR